MKKKQAHRALFGTLLFFSVLFIFGNDAQAVIRYSVKINDGDSKTSERRVRLSIQAPSEVEDMRMGNSLAEVGQAGWEPFDEEETWTLPGRYGKQTIYVQFRTEDGETSRVYRDSIFLELQEDPKVKINDGEERTENRRVELYIVPPPNARRMRIAGTRDVAEERWQSVRREVNWTLPKQNGRKYVYVQFQYADSRMSNIYSDSIILSEPVEPVATFEINGGVGQTENQTVRLTFTGVRVYDQIRVSNTGDFANARWTSLTRSMTWLLAGRKGTNTVSVEFKTDDETKKETVRKNIHYAPPSVDGVPGGGLVKDAQGTMYYFGVDRALHPFRHTAVLLSHYKNIAEARQLTPEEIEQTPIGQPVCIRQGTWLVHFRGFARIYAVEPGCVLRPIRSEVEAHVLYGPNWSHRVITLHATESRIYTIESYAAKDRLHDLDGDGLLAELETGNGSSDSLEDTDEDRLSDVEEILYWKTSPARSDSDGDGVGDGLEVLQGRRPDGNGTIDAIPANTYRYPTGTLVYDWWKNKRYYYRAVDGTFYSVARRHPEQRFVSNRFQEQFVVQPPYPLTLPTSNRFISSNDALIQGPLKTVAGSLLHL